VWFNQVHIPKQFPVGTEVSVTGKVQWNKRVPELLATEIVKAGGEGPAEEMIPVYAETARLNSKTIRTIMKTVLHETRHIFPEIMPEEGPVLMERPQAYREIHFPVSGESLNQARERLVIEEILFLQLALAHLRSPHKTRDKPCIKNGGNSSMLFWKDFLSNSPPHRSGLSERSFRIWQKAKSDDPFDSGRRRLREDRSSDGGHLTGSGIRFSGCYDGADGGFGAATL
jgi:ATP-dependent DNA helicase RecG